MRGAAGWDPPGVLQGASGMPGMAEGSQWHEPLTLNKRLAVVPGLDPGSGTAARLSGLIDFTPTITEIPPTRSFDQLFPLSEDTCLLINEDKC